MQKLFNKWRKKSSLFLARLIMLAMSLIWYLTIIGRLSTTWGAVCEAFFTILQAMGSLPQLSSAEQMPPPPIHNCCCAIPCSSHTQKHIQAE
jgi:hypothetical protein